MNLNLLSVILAGVLVALVSTEASAVDLERLSMANAVGRCQGALPNYEGAIRKRPLAVQNEGTGSAFVTCAFLSSCRTGGIRPWTASACMRVPPVASPPPSTARRS